jgi:ABC-type transport system substrate-binding protein
LEIEIEYFDWPTYLEKLRTKSLQVYFSGWMADIPDVENFLQVFYSKSSPWPNSSNFSNAEFDRLYEQASVMQDSAERTELYRKAERIVVEEVPCGFIYHRIFYVMYHEWIENFKPNAYKPDSFGYGLSKYYKIDTAKRNAYKKTNK